MGNAPGLSACLGSGIRLFPSRPSVGDSCRRPGQRTGTKSSCHGVPSAGKGKNEELRHEGLPRFCPTPRWKACGFTPPQKSPSHWLSCNCFPIMRALIGQSRTVAQAIGAAAIGGRLSKVFRHKLGSRKETERKGKLETEAGLRKRQLALAYQRPRGGSSTLLPLD